jgi:hypothetical protein
MIRIAMHAGFPETGKTFQSEANNYFCAFYSFQNTLFGLQNQLCFHQLNDPRLLCMLSDPIGYRC